MLPIVGMIGRAVYANGGQYRYAILPLTAIAGAAVGVAYGGPTGTVGGFIDAYRAAQREWAWEAFWLYMFYGLSEWLIRIDISCMPLRISTTNWWT